MVESPMVLGHGGVVCTKIGAFHEEHCLEVISKKT